MGWFDKGKSDAEKNKGPQDMTNKAWQEKEKYDAGYHQGKNEQKKK